MTCILVVEDNDLNRQLVETILTSNGYALVQAATGEEGVELFGEHSIDLVLMDLQLPGIDGYEAFRRISTSMQTKTPVIAMTGNATAADRQKAESVGFDDFLKKPFRIEEMLSMIKQHLT